MSTQQSLVTHFGAVYAASEYKGAQWFMFERDFRHYLTWGKRLTRESLVVMLELVGRLQFDGGAIDDFIVRGGSRSLGRATGIDRRNIPDNIKRLKDLGLLEVIDLGSPDTIGPGGEVLEGAPAVYDLAVAFKTSFPQWLKDGKPKAKAVPRGLAAKKAANDNNEAA
jgi:hypothetical protein